MSPPRRMLSVFLRAMRPAPRPGRGTGGSVLMEYVVLCCFLGIAVVMAVHNGFYNHAAGYVGIGRGYVWFQRLRLYALSLPIP